MAPRGEPWTRPCAVFRTWGTTPAERALPFGCDRALPPADDAVYRAVDVDAPAALVFRWLCQLRLAPYSYDWIDNLGRQSPPRLVPGLDALAVGQRFIAIFTLVAFEPGREITFATRLSRWLGAYAVTYRVVAVGARRSRLTVKLVMAYPPVVRRVLRRLGPAADFVMMRKQLLTLKRFAERDAQETTASRS
jgi:hypothetical protein